jgi:phage terminase Nu1 subunit (DNA packaging protein)
VTLVSGNQLSRHLGVSRQAVDALAAQQVIVRRSDGYFDQDRARICYIQHLRSERRGSARSQADVALAQAKARMLNLRIAEREREVISMDEAIETVEEIVGLTLTVLGGAPAKYGGHDLPLRRKLEAMVFEIRKAISKAASKMADERGEPMEPDA